MLRVGLTGNIGSGKSLIASVFEVLGVPVFKADEQARQLIISPPLVDKLVAFFGREILDHSGNPDRQKLASRVFESKADLDYLNSLVHPAVRNNFDTFCALQVNAAYVMYEAAILIETGYYRNLDKIILVTAPADVRIERVMHRDRVSRSCVEVRMKHQWDEEKKIPLCDHLVNNDGVHPLVAQCIAIHRALSAGQ